MSKQPAIQWYMGDWFKDKECAKCSPQTRGIWIDALNSMASGDRDGKLTGSIEQLSRVCRCSPEQMRAAVDELAQTEAADVRECNGVVTLTNRRMQREHKERVATKKRVEKHRKANAVTPEKRERNGPSSSSSSISTSVSPPSGGAEEGVENVVDRMRRKFRKEAS